MKKFVLATVAVVLSAGAAFAENPNVAPLPIFMPMTAHQSLLSKLTALQLLRSAKLRSWMVPLIALATHRLRAFRTNTEFVNNPA